MNNSKIRLADDTSDMLLVNVGRSTKQHILSNLGGGTGGHIQLTYCGLDSADSQFSSSISFRRFENTETVQRDICQNCLKQTMRLGMVTIQPVREIEYQETAEQDIDSIVAAEEAASAATPAPLAVTVTLTRDHLLSIAKHLHAAIDSITEGLYEDGEDSESNPDVAAIIEVLDVLGMIEGTEEVASPMVEIANEQASGLEVAQQEVARTHQAVGDAQAEVERLVNISDTHYAQYGMARGAHQQTMREMKGRTDAEANNARITARDRMEITESRWKESANKVYTAQKVHGDAVVEYRRALAQRRLEWELQQDDQ